MHHHGRGVKLINDRIIIYRILFGITVLLCSVTSIAVVYLIMKAKDKYLDLKFTQ